MKNKTYFVYLCLVCIYIRGNYATTHELISYISDKVCRTFKSCSDGNSTILNSINGSDVIAITGTDASHANDDGVCCLYCSCDIDQCIDKQNCCPGVEVNNNNNNYTAHYSLLTCSAVQVNLKNNKSTPKNESFLQQFPGGDVGIYMVHTCSGGRHDESCENPDYKVLGEMLPETAVRTGIVYRNVFCAICNGVFEMVPWRAYVTCSAKQVLKSDILLFPHTASKLYTYVVTSGQANCGAYFKPPISLKHETYPCILNDHLIETCNANTSNVCEAQSVPTIDPPILEHNSKNASHENRCPSNLTFSEYPESLFTGLLNNAGSSVVDLIPGWEQDDLTPDMFIPDSVSCNATFLYDPYKTECRRWYCPNGRQLVGSYCSPLYKEVINAKIGLRLEIRPEEASMDTFIEENKTDMVHGVVDSIFGRDIGREIIIIGIKKDKSFIYTFILIHVVDGTDTYSKLYNESTYDQHVFLSGASGEMFLKVGFASGVKIEMGTFYLTDIILIDLTDYTSLRDIFKLNIKDIEYALQFPYISKLNFCTQILLLRTEVRDYVDIIDIRTSNIRLRHGDFIETYLPEQGGFRVCLSDYLKKAKEHLIDSLKDEGYSPQAILSVICNMMSMVGLLVTLVTYFIFDELRSIPGKNNIMLALHLLIAQCLYQFGMDQTEMPKLCIALGAFIHLFWLTAIFWMNACTLHMFRTFVTGQSYRSVRILDPQVLCYGFYCYGIAVSMVAINIGVSLYRSNGQDYGYGGHVCYISDPVMVGWVFALPVGVIIILNMGFFFAVVYQISASTMRRRGKSTDRTNTIIYMKLSSLTGVTWIFGYLYMWTNFAPLEYIFIVLNAGQGVLIFISFICTKRIVKLYWNLLRKNSRPCRLSACWCFRKSPVSETNGIDINTAKISLTGSSRSKGLPMIGRFSQHGLRKKASKKKIILKNNTSEGPSSKHETSDIFQESMTIAKSMSNPAFKGDKSSRKMDESVSNGFSISEDQGPPDIATISLHQIDINQN